MPKFEFMECDTCRAKTGSLALCVGCLHNRQIIEQMETLEKDVSTRLKASIDHRINDLLCDTKPDSDDLIVGINDAWEAVGKAFTEAGVTLKGGERLAIEKLDQWRKELPANWYQQSLLKQLSELLHSLTGTKEDTATVVPPNGCECDPTHYRQGWRSVHCPVHGDKEKAGDTAPASPNNPRG